MAPSSAVIRAPTIPTSAIAVSSGASSVITLAATTLPMTQSGSAASNW